VRTRPIGALLLVVLGLAACAGPFGVVRIDPQTVGRELTANALSASRPSTESRNVLIERGLLDDFEDRPEEALAALHRSMVAERADADVLFALAELSFLHGEASGKMPHHLAAAVYAYAFLFPEGVGEVPGRFDPRLRLAADIYNRALTMALLSDDGSEVVPRAGTFALPFGEIAVDFDPAALRIGERTLYRLIPVAELSVEGLAMRYRRAGLGAPLAASTMPTDASAPPGDFVGPRVRVPVTVLLRVERSRQALIDQRPLAGKLDAFLYAEPEQVEIAGERVPIEVEPTAALALTLSELPVVEIELLGFLGALAGKREATLVSTTPYRPGRMPVIFVHGTASSPVRWAEMMNRLEADPVIRHHYQFWFFTYDSANPVAYSALQLRRALREAAEKLDPGRGDPAVRRGVLIGHSQGGLLAKMMAIDSGDRFWRAITDRKFEELDLSEETRSNLREALFVTPLPGLARVIFIATPHRGSFVAGRFVTDLVRRFVRFPGVFAGLAADMLRNPDVFATQIRSGVLIPSAVDNMSPRHQFIQTIQHIPLSPRVKAHSIIAVRGSGPVAEGDDGVVAYSSAHIDGVESEKVVRSGHSVQGHPETIEEVRRILRLHAGQP
jgi:pimeloyl-ACP methyl ester carboxylesterase